MFSLIVKINPARAASFRYLDPGLDSERREKAGMLKPAENGFTQGEGSLLGAGWREVSSFDEVDDVGDDYSYEEEVSPEIICSRGGN